MTVIYTYKNSNNEFVFSFRSLVFSKFITEKIGKQKYREIKISCFIFLI